ncbi:MAG: M14 family zinc carboxypeptidase [candidate division WOR-3 bacterium]
MKTHVLSLTIIVFISLISQHKLPADEMKIPPRLDLIEVKINNLNEVKVLERIGVIINKVHNDKCIGEASPEVIELLKRLGFSYQILQENISRLYYENFFTKAEKGRYLTYSEFIDTMAIIANNNPTICKLETLGFSHQNRLILALKISDNPLIDEDEPAVYFDGNIHGDEKIGWAVCFEFIKYLMNNYNVNPVVTNLINTREIWIVPMINPDGYVNNVRYNGRNVDLNRNFGWMWGNESNCGSDAFSENEATAFYNLFIKQPFVVYTTYHAGESIISCPWSYTANDSVPEKFIIWHLAQGYSQRGNNYPYGQGSIIMYLINGSSKDYCYGVAGEVSWSIEVHNIKTPPASAIDPTFNINRDAMLYLCHKAGQGIHGVVTDSVTGEPIYAQIWVYPRNWLSYSSPVNGDFHRFYLPGVYTVKVRAAGYQDVERFVFIPNTGDSAVFLDIKMLRDSVRPANYGMRVVATRYVTTSANLTYPVRALGLRDGVHYQLDNTKWIIIEMAKPIRNDSGYDFTVIRSAGTGNATVKVSNNWKGPWTTIGTANASLTHFDLATVNMDSARYVRLDASGTFGLDAIEEYRPSTSIAEFPELTSSFDFQIIPTFSHNQLTFRCSPQEQEFLVSIYDILGNLKETIRVSPKTNAYVYNLKDSYGRRLKPGIYFAKVLVNNKIVSSKKFLVLDGKF